jgi:esterase/lipase superfamily enzyme
MAKATKKPKKRATVPSRGPRDASRSGPPRVTFTDAVDLVRAALPRRSRNIDVTLVEVGLVNADMRAAFIQRLVHTAAEQGVRIRRSDLPHAARTTLHDVAAAIATQGETVRGAPRKAGGKTGRSSGAPTRTPPRKSAPKRVERSTHGVLPAAPTAKPADYAVVKVFFGTDRSKTGHAEPARYFSGKRAAPGEFTYGVTDVSIPRDHRLGALESPAWWRLEFQPDPARHVVLLSLSPLDKDAFVAHARADIAVSPGHDALLFIHGYNVGFADAARRTAQIAYDLGFTGVPMLYSWPSEGTVVRYSTDATNMRHTLPRFTEFLTLALAALQARVVHVIAHSMGNNCLVEMLKTFDATTLGKDVAALGQVIFAAPDIDAETFVDLARQFRGQANRFTLYASSGDLALQASKKLNGYPRAGDAGPGLVIVDGVDTIDATLVDTNLMGHSYIGDNDSILADVFDLLRGGHAPEARFRLAPRQRAGQRYWFFRR